MASIRPQTRAMIESLVGFDTTSAKSNLALIDFAQQYLESLGVRCRRTLDPEAGKANLFASLGPEAPGGVVLSGHSDRSEEHTSELQSLMRISYAVFCLKQKA